MHVKKVPRADPVIKNMHKSFLAFLLIMQAFAMPFSSGNSVFLIISTIFLLAFNIHMLRQGHGQTPALGVRLKKHHPVIFYALLGFCLSSLASYIPVMLGENTPLHKFAATIQYLFYLLMLAHAFSLAKFCLSYPLPPTRLFVAYLGGCLALITLLLSFYHLSLAAPAGSWAIRAPFGEHVRIMGMIASVSVVNSVALFMFTDRPHRLYRFLLPGSLLACSAFLIWTGSRTSMLVTLVITLALICYGLWSRKLQPAQALLLAVILGAAIPVAQQFSIFPWSGLNRAITVSIPTDTPHASPENPALTTGDQLTSGRLTMWTKAWEGITAAPWFGYGPNGYYFHPMHHEDYIHPHNLVLQFLVEWGIVGSGFLLILLGSLLWQGIKRLPAAMAHNDTDFILPGLVVITLVITSLTDGVFFISQSLFCITMAFAAFPFLDHKERQHLSKPY